MLLDALARWSRSWPEGFRAAMPLLLPTAAVGLSFGLVASPMLGPIATILMSCMVWSGTAQFAALTVLGGGPSLAVGAGLLANTRFLPMGFAIAPSMTGGPVRRALQGALLADASFVIGHRADGRFDLSAITWAAPPQYVGWVGGTIAGVLGADRLGDPRALGLDVVFPVFYLSLLLPELRRDGSRTPLTVALAAAAITLALTPIALPGVPVLAAAAVALIGLRRPRSPA